MQRGQSQAWQGQQPARYQSVFEACQACPDQESMKGLSDEQPVREAVVAAVERHRLAWYLRWSQQHRANQGGQSLHLAGCLPGNSTGFAKSDSVPAQTVKRHQNACSMGAVDLLLGTPMFIAVWAACGSSSPGSPGCS